MKKARRLLKKTRRASPVAGIIRRGKGPRTFFDKLS